MSVDPIRYSGGAVDLASRITFSTTVAASPALAAETIIAQVQLPDNFRAAEAVLIDGWAAITVGTSGTAVTFRIRRTSVAGTLIVSSGALTGGVAAAALLAQDICAVDTTSALIYVLTAQVTLASAGSTVSAVRLVATCI